MSTSALEQLTEEPFGLTLRDLALKATVYPAIGNRFRVVLGSGRVAWATAKWQNGEPVVESANPVAKLAVEMHERGRVAKAQGL